MSEAFHREVAPGVFLIDTGYLRPRSTAAWLVVDAGRAAFVETGTARNLDRLLGVLEALDLDVGQVDQVLVTHVHLDHAGGAGALLARLPEAKLVVHPRGARHLVDPERLTASTIAVYGEAAFRAIHGELTPVPAGRVIEGGEDTRVQVGGRTLRLIDTPGHAYHHFCVHDEVAGGVFTGDTFGLGYPELITARGAFLFPTTTPIHFDPEAMHRSIDRIVALGAERLFLTHYGVASDPSAHAAGLHALIDAFVALARAQDGSGAAWQAGLAAAMGELLRARIRDHGCTLDEASLNAILVPDLELNSQGLSAWAQRPASV